MGDKGSTKVSESTSYDRSVIGRKSKGDDEIAIYHEFGETTKSLEPSGGLPRMCNEMYGILGNPTRFMLTF